MQHARILAARMPSREHDVEGAPRQRGPTPTQLSIHGSIRPNSPSPSHPTCEQHAEHSEQESGLTVGVSPHPTLLHSQARTRAACSMPNRLDSVLPRYMCARGITYLLASECRIFARSAQNLAASAREQKSKAIEAAADREVAVGSRSTGEPNLPSAARSRQPHPTDAAPPGQPALSHNILHP